jgi:hypothetical protein
MVADAVAVPGRLRERGDVPAQDDRGDPIVERGQDLQQPASTRQAGAADARAVDLGQPAQQAEAGLKLEDAQAGQIEAEEVEAAEQEVAAGV